MADAPNYQSLIRNNSTADYSISLEFGRVWPYNSRYTTDVQSQGVKGHGHSV